MLMMDEEKKVPLTIGNNVIGTALVHHDGKIDIDFDINLCKRHGFYDFLVAGTLDHISIGESPISETKETNNG